MRAILATAVVALAAGVAYVGGPSKVGFALLNVYRQVNLKYLTLTGRTPESEAERRIVSGEAWSDYCDALKAAGAGLVSAGAPTDPFNQAEGYRYLTRLVRGSLESMLEAADPFAPVLVSIADGKRAAPVKLGADNPDNLYQSANLDSRETYRLHGKRGTVNYLGFGTQSGSYGEPGGLNTVMYKDAGSDFDVAADGSFSLVISATKPPAVSERNWLQLRGPEPVKALLIVRQTFLNRDAETPADVHVERTSGPHRPSPLTPQMVDDALRSSALFVAAVPFMFARWSKGFMAHENTLPLFDQETSNKAGGDPNIRYYHSYWRLQPDEALVISVVPPPCPHWNFQLNNHWMESLDHRYFSVHVNKHTARYRRDGSVRVVVAHQDPQLKDVTYNWIDTTSHTQGQMLLRWVKPNVSDSQLPQPATRIVKFADLARELASSSSSSSS